MELIPQYVNPNEYYYQMAQGSEVWDNNVYQNLSDEDKTDYLKAAANFNEYRSPDFNLETYKTLRDANDKYGYLIHSNFGDKSSEDYKKNQEYFDYKLTASKMQNAYDDADAFTKLGYNLAGIGVNLFNMVTGVVEGLKDVLVGGSLYLSSAFSNWSGDTEHAKALEQEARDQWEKDTVQEDLKNLNVALGGNENDFENLSLWAANNTALQREGSWKIINDVTVNLAKMTINWIPGVGQTIYFTSMAGNTLQSAAQMATMVEERDSVSIPTVNLVMYSALVTAVEFGTEHLVGDVFFGKGLINTKTLVSKVPTVMGRWMADLGLTFLSEGMEESLSEYLDGMLEKWFIDPQSDTSLQQVLYAGLIGGLTGIIGEAVGILKTDKLDTKAGKLSHIDSFLIQNLTTEAMGEIDKGSAVAALMDKYNMSIPDLAIRHTEEYKTAVAQDRTQSENVAKAYTALMTFMSQLSPEDATRASEYLKADIETKAAMARADLAYSDETFNQVQQAAIDRYNKYNTDGSKFVPKNELTQAEFQVVDAVRKSFPGANVVIGDVTGQTNWNGAVTYQNTIFINANSLRNMSPSQITYQLIGHEIVHSLQFNKNILSKQNMDDIDEIMLGKGYTLDYDKIDISQQYIGNDKDGLATRAEKQAYFYANAMMFDSNFIKIAFQQKRTVFQKMYDWMYNLSKYILTNGEKNRTKYEILQKSMRAYRLCIADNVGNAESIQEAVKYLQAEITPEQMNEMVALYDARRFDAHYIESPIGKNYFVADKDAAYKALTDNRKNPIEEFDIEKIADINYYTDEFIEQIINQYSGKYSYLSYGDVKETSEVKGIIKYVALAFPKTSYDDITGAEGLQLALANTTIDEVNARRGDLTFYKELLWRAGFNEYLSNFNMAYDYIHKTIVKSIDVVPYLAKPLKDIIPTNENQTAITQYQSQKYKNYINSVENLYDFFDSSIETIANSEFLKSIKISFVQLPKGETGLVKTAQPDTIYLNESFLDSPYYNKYDGDVNTQVFTSTLGETIYDTLIHEFQHIVQINFNGMYRGASPDQLYAILNDFQRIEPDNFNKLKKQLAPLFTKESAEKGIGVNKLAMLLYYYDLGEVQAQTNEFGKLAIYQTGFEGVYRERTISEVSLQETGVLRGTGRFAVLNQYNIEIPISEGNGETFYETSTDTKTKLTKIGFKKTSALVKEYKSKVAEYKESGLNKTDAAAKAFGDIQVLLAENYTKLTENFDADVASRLMNDQITKLNEYLDISGTFKGTGSKVFDEDTDEKGTGSERIKEEGDSPEDVLQKQADALVTEINESSIKQAILQYARSSEGIDTEKYNSDLEKLTAKYGRKKALEIINQDVLKGKYNKLGKLTVKGLREVYNTLKYASDQLTQSQLNDAVDYINNILEKHGKEPFKVIEKETGLHKTSEAVNIEEASVSDIKNKIIDSYNITEKTSWEKFDKIYNNMIQTLGDKPSVVKATREIFKEYGYIPKNNSVKSLRDYMKSSPDIAKTVLKDYILPDGKLNTKEMDSVKAHELVVQIREAKKQASQKLVEKTYTKREKTIKPLSTKEYVKKPALEQKQDIKITESEIKKPDVSRETKAKLETNLQEKVDINVKKELKETGKLTKDTKKDVDTATNSKFYRKGAELEAEGKKILDSKLDNKLKPTSEKTNKAIRDTLDIDYVDANGEKTYTKINQQHLTEEMFAQTFPEEQFYGKFKQVIKNVPANEMVDYVNNLINSKNNLDSKESINTDRAIKYIYEHRNELGLSKADADKLQTIYTTYVRQSANSLRETYTPNNSTKTTTEFIRETTGNKDFTVNDDTYNDITKDVNSEKVDTRVKELQTQLEESKNKFDTQIAELQKKLDEAQKQYKDSTDKTKQEKSINALENKIDQVNDLKNENISEINKKLYYYQNLQNALASGDKDAVVDAMMDIYFSGIDNNGVSDTKSIAQTFSKLARQALKETIAKETKKKWKEMSSKERTTALQRIQSKIRGYRYFAMLSSPSTWIKNYVGNEIMKGLDSITSSLDKHMEAKFVKSENQLKYYSNQTIDTAVTEFVDGMKDQIALWSKGNKYDDTVLHLTPKNISDLLGEKIDADLFKTKFMNAYNNTVKAILNKADQFSVEYAINKNLQQVLQANLGWIRSQLATEAMLSVGAKDEETLKKKLQEKSNLEISMASMTMKGTELYNALFNNDVKALLNNMSEGTRSVLFESAVTRGLQTYFKNSNNISNLYNKMCKDHPYLAFVLGITSPFIKVQTNMMTTFFKYSPFEWFEVLYKGIKLKDARAKDLFAEAKFSRSVSQATVGSIGFAMGMLLGALGKAIGVGIEYDKEDYLGLSLKLGDLKLSLGDTSPFNGTLALGVSLVEMFQDFPEGFNTFSNVLYDYTLLGNLNDIAEYNQNALDFVGSTVENWLGQYIPAVVRNFARFVDPGKKKKSTNKVLHLLETMASNIPGLSFVVPNKVDPYTGNIAYRSFATANSSLNGALARVFEAVNQFSGVKINYKKKSDVQKEAERVGADTSGFTGKMTINGQSYTTRDSKYSQIRAEYVNQQLTVLFASSKYKNMSDKDKKSAIESVYRDGTELAKSVYWTDQGHTRVFTTQESYNKFKKYLSKATIKKNWKGSKYVQ